MQRSFINEGTITVTANGDYSDAISNIYESGLYAAGNDNWLTNSGTITVTTNGNLASPQIESGWVFSAGLSADGDHNTLVNTGRLLVSTSGDHSDPTELSYEFDDIYYAPAGMLIRGNQNSLINHRDIIVQSSGTWQPGVTKGNFYPYGMLALGGGNRLVNMGTINVSYSGKFRNGGSSSGSFGIGADGDDNIIINHGDIYVDGLGDMAPDFTPTSKSGSGATRGIEIGAWDLDSDKLSSRNLAINYGTIVAKVSLQSGRYAEGIFFDVDDGLLINYGSIHAEGPDANGIYMTGRIEDAPSIATNYGHIVAISPHVPTEFDETAKSFGMVLQGPYGDMYNYGTIHASGHQTYGMQGFDLTRPIIGGYTLANYGFIKVVSNGSPYTNVIDNKLEQPIAHGMDVEFKGRIVNHGSVRVIGPEANGAGLVALNALNTIVNSRSVISEHGASIRFKNENKNGTNQGGNRLHLMAPSFLGGIIELRERARTLEPTEVSITTGPSHSIIWHFDGPMKDTDPILSGPIPVYLDRTTPNAIRVATYDPSSLVGAHEQLGDITGQLAELGRAHLDDESALGSSADPDALSAAYSPDRSSHGRAWLTGFGGHNDRTGNATLLGREAHLRGIATGVTGAVSNTLSLGFMGGYLADTVKTAPSRWVPTHKTDSEGFFTGLNGNYQHNRWLLSGGITGGFIEHRAERFINDNLAQDSDGATRGNSRAKSKYSSLFVSSEAALGVELSPEPSLLSLQPHIRLRYSRQKIDGFRENGAWTTDSNARVAPRTLGLLHGEAEIRVGQPIDNGNLTGIATIIGGYQRRWNMGDQNVDVTLLGLTKALNFVSGANGAIYAGVGFVFALSNAIRLKLNTKGYVGQGSESYQGRMSLSMKF